MLDRFVCAHRGWHAAEQAPQKGATPSWLSTLHLQHMVGKINTIGFAGFPGSGACVRGLAACLVTSAVAVDPLPLFLQPFPGFTA